MNASRYGRRRSQQRRVGGPQQLLDADVAQQARLLLDLPRLDQAAAEVARERQRDVREPAGDRPDPLEVRQREVVDDEGQLGEVARGRLEVGRAELLDVHQPEREALMELHDVDAELQEGHLVDGVGAAGEPGRDARSDSTGAAAD